MIYFMFPFFLLTFFGDALEEKSRSGYPILHFVSALRACRKKSTLSTIPHPLDHPSLLILRWQAMRIAIAIEGK